MFEGPFKAKTWSKPAALEAAIGCIATRRKHAQLARRKDPRDGAPYPWQPWLLLTPARRAPSYRTHGLERQSWQRLNAATPTPRSLERIMQTSLQIQAGVDRNRHGSNVLDGLLTASALTPSTPRPLPNINKPGGFATPGKTQGPADKDQAERVRLAKERLETMLANMAAARRAAPGPVTRPEPVKVAPGKTDSVAKDPVKPNPVDDKDQRIRDALERDAAMRAAAANPNATVRIQAGSLPNTEGLSESQKYALYATQLRKFGNAQARADLEAGRKVVLSIRQNTNVRANQGKGVYDDRMAMLWVDRLGNKRAQEFRANTEPSGQYEHRGPYARKTMGQDVNGDGRRDLGRLTDGSYRYSGKGIFLRSAALWSTQDQKVSRDTNHNGRFDESRTYGRDDYAMYIHAGGSDNTWSAGCQTLPPDEHARFFSCLGNQNNLSYVLVNVNRLG
jgi:hypothetical protein